MTNRLPFSIICQIPRKTAPMASVCTPVEGLRTISIWTHLEPNLSTGGAGVTTRVGVIGEDIAADIEEDIAGDTEEDVAGDTEEDIAEDTTGVGTTTVATTKDITTEMMSEKGEEDTVLRVRGKKFPSGPESLH